MKFYAERVDAARPSSQFAVINRMAGFSRFTLSFYLVYQEWESRTADEVKQGTVPCRISRGIEPQRFIAEGLIATGKLGGALEGIRPSFGLGPWSSD
jgi:hypothetical protein